MQRVEQAVELLAQPQVEALLVLQHDAPRHVALRGRIGHGHHIGLGGQLLGAVEPLAHGAALVSGAVEDGRGAHVVGSPAQHHAGFAVLAQVTQACQRLGRVFVENAYRAAHHGGRVEGRVGAAEGRHVTLQDAAQRPVDVDDLAVGIGNAHRQGGHVQRLLDAQCFVLDAAFFGLHGRFALFCGQGLSDVLPFDHQAQALPGGVNHRIDDQVEVVRSDRQAIALFLGQLGEHAGLVLWATQEVTDGLPLEALGIKAAQFSLQFVAGAVEHGLQRLVEVDDVVFGIGHHHVGGRHVQRLADAFGHFGAPLRVGRLEALAHLHAAQGAHQAGHLVFAARGHQAIKTALAEALQPASGVVQAAAQRAHGVGCEPAGGHHHRQGCAHQPQVGLPRAYQPQPHGQRGQRAQGLGPLRQRGHGPTATQPRALGRHHFTIAHGPSFGPAFLEGAVGGLGTGDLLAGGRRAHREVAHDRIAFQQRRHVGHHPVVVAVLPAVLDQPGPGPALLE